MKKQEEEPTIPKKTLYTIALPSDQMEKLRVWCDHQLWEAYEVAYASFAFKGDGVNVVAYTSGKLVIQGKKTEEFVTYVLEAEITHTPQLGYERLHHPEWFEAHAGLDESGKGDLFGPLVTACVIADAKIVDQWIAQGLRESKKVTSDAAVFAMEKKILETPDVVVEKLSFSMPKYNELYDRFGKNLNRLLAWMHAKCLEQALGKRDVPWGMLDQFTKSPLVQGYFKNTSFNLKMQPRAEEDPVVAAASIIARAEYIRQLRFISKSFGELLSKGVSAKVKDQAKRIVEKFGPASLGQFAKLHFRTASETLGLPVPEKRPWINHT